jgi:signal transduction histidine kinase/CheY-like chemotaxis protein
MRSRGLAVPSDTASSLASRFRPGLRAILLATLAGLGVVMMGLLTFTAGTTATTESERAIGRSLVDLASAMRDAVDGDLADRFRDLRILASAVAVSNMTAPTDSARRLVADVASVDSDYRWIAIANSAGRVMLAAGDMMEGTDASDQLWVQRGLQGAAILDHGGKSPRPDDDRVLWVALPFARAGTVHGVVGAGLAWEWVVRLRANLMARAHDRHPDAEVVLLDRGGRAILGDVAMARAWTSQPAKASGYRQVRDQDGRDLIIGASRPAVGSLVAQLGWTVLVISSAEVALAPATALRNRILIAGGALVLVFIGASLLLSAWIAAPLRAIAGQADRIGLPSGAERIEIALPRNASREIVSLAASLQAMLDRLTRNEASLREINAELEARVESRTDELKHTVAELAAARDAAVSATQAKSRFLAAASHDLRQPLHALSLFSRALARRVTDRTQVELVGNIETTLGSVRAMFDTLLDVSKLDAGIVVPEPTVFTLEEVFERLKPSLGAHAKALGLELRVVASSVAVMSDPTLVETMLRNLVDNALKFSAGCGAGRRVLLGARRRGDAVAIEVHDRGPGISPERHRRIFEEFERTTQAGRKANDGLGLGLAIVRRLAALLSIRVELASELGRGSVFRLVLPVETRRIVSPAAGDPVSLKGRNILLVDDDPAIGAAVTRLLDDAGARVSVAASSAEADAARTEGIDLALVDLALGDGVDGLSLAQRWRNGSVRPLPVLIVTGSTDTPTLTRLRDSGLSWLTKPVDGDVLKREIARMLAG